MRLCSPPWLETSPLKRVPDLACLRLLLGAAEDPGKPLLPPRRRETCSGVVLLHILLGNSSKWWQGVLQKRPAPSPRCSLGVPCPLTGHCRKLLAPASPRLLLPSCCSHRRFVKRDSPGSRREMTPEGHQRGHRRRQEDNIAAPPHCTGRLCAAT